MKQENNYYKHLREIELDKIKTESETNKLVTKQFIVMVMFAIFMICGTSLIYNVFFAREYVDINCSATGINYQQSQHIYDNEKMQLDNTTITCSGKINVQNIVLMITK